jgi:hypothetical protein
MSARWIGRLLRPFKAGEQKLAWHHPACATAPVTLDLRSDGFGAAQAIPLRYAGQGVGDNLSPPLAWNKPPAGTRELVLIVEDPDAPLPRPFVHAIVCGIGPERDGLAEGALSADLPAGLSMGLNSFRKQAYAGPRALPGHGPHGYRFQLFALDQPLHFDQAPTLARLLPAMAGHVLARGQLKGWFERL